MHIAEGMLSGPVLGVGAALSVVGVGIGLRSVRAEQMPRVALLSSAFFIASLVHIPVGATTAHLILNGLAGIVLGWAAFPAFLVALLLQTASFGFGGVSVLGVNTFIMAFPAIVVFYLFGGLFRRDSFGGSPRMIFLIGFGAGALSVALSVILFSGILYFTKKEYVGVAGVVLILHIPVMIIEGLVTGSMVVFLKKVRPELLSAPLRRE